MSTRTTLGLVTAALTLIGCSGDPPPANATPDLAQAAALPDLSTPSTAGKGKISGTVKYAGTKMGTLKFALYDQAPGPTTPPKYFMFPSVMSPTFPYAYTLDAIEPGAYYVVVILD